MPSPEWNCLVALRAARRQFFDDIVQYARDHYAPQPGRRREVRKLEETVGLLRSDFTYQIAEFYFTVEAQKLANKDRIKEFIERHEKARMDLLHDPAKLELLGLKKDRLDNARFTQGHINEIVDSIQRSGEPARLQINITTLAKFLTTLMSPSSCENAVLALRDANLISCQNLATSVRIDDPSDLVAYYRKHLTQMLTALRERP